SVPGVEYRAGNKLIGCQQVGQETVRRAVELLEEPHEEVLVELVGGPEIHDVYAEHALSSWRAIESHRVDVKVLTEVPVWLKREPEEAAVRLPLERIHRVVENVWPFAEAGVDMQPAENLDAAIEIDIAPLVESLAEPRFVTLAASYLQIALPCEVEANASVQEVFVAVLHFIASALGPIKRVHSLQPEIAALLRVKAHLP